MSRGRDVRQPPRIPDATLKTMLPPGVVGKSIRGDLREEFALRFVHDGHLRAVSWFWRESLGVIVRSIRARLAGGRAWQRRQESRIHAPVGERNTMFERLVNDFGSASRSLIRAPGFASLVVVTLALGIGANVAIYSVVKAVLLDPLPYADSERLVVIGNTAPGIQIPGFFGVSIEFFLQYREHADALEDMGLYGGFGGTLTVDGEAERLRMAEVTQGFFSTLGVVPHLGRFAAPEELLPPDEGSWVQPVLISHGLWQRRFGSDPNVLGRLVEINDNPFRITGVMGPELSLPEEETVAWVTERYDPTNIRPGRFTSRLIARTVPGARPEALATQLDAIARRLPEIYPDNPRYANLWVEGQLRPVVRTLHRDLFGDVARALWILLGTVWLVLLIACANVANLTLVRAETRQGEFAIRAALGAGRAQLIRSRLAEALLLAAGGGIAGAIFAWLILPTLLAAAPAGVRRLDQVEIDLQVLAYATLASVAAAVVFGLAPAIRMSQPRVRERLHAGGRGLTAGRDRHAARNALVVSQAAIAIVLLIGSGLLLRSFAQLRNVDPGYDTEDIFSFQLALPRDEFPDPFSSAAFHMDFHERLASLPGVEAVGAIRNLPLDESASQTTFVIEDHQESQTQELNFVAIHIVSPGFFGTMGIDLLEGRGFVRADHESNWSSGYVVVSRTMAERQWPGQSALGKRLRPTDEESGWNTVIGVVEDVRDRDLRLPPAELVYFPMVSRHGADGWTVNSPAYVIRARNAGAFASIVLDQIRQVDAAMPMYAVHTMEELVAENLVQLSFTGLTLAIAATLALVLGTVGLYGVLSYVVSQRTHEIGLRMALGARAAHVRRMVVMQGGRLMAAGTMVGILGAAALTRLLGTLLYGISPLDPVTFMLVALTMLGVGLLATYVPARRASTVDPMEAMRLH